MSETATSAVYGILVEKIKNDTKMLGDKYLESSEHFRFITISTYTI